MAQKALADKEAVAEELEKLKRQDLGGMQLAEVEGELHGWHLQSVRTCLASQADRRLSRTCSATLRTGHGSNGQAHGASPCCMTGIVSWGLTGMHEPAVPGTPTYSLHILHWLRAGCMLLP